MLLTKLYAACLLKACLIHFLFTLGHSACVEVAPKMDYSGVSPGLTDHSAGVVPPTKRSKLYALFSL